MTATLVVALVLSAVAFWTVRESIVVVPEDTAVVIERLGRYSRTAGAGRTVIVPLIERCAHRHSLAEQRAEVDGFECISRDNQVVTVEAWVAFRVVDPQKASYQVDDLGNAVVSLARTVLREAVGRVDADRLYDERRALENRMTELFEKAGEAWGIATSGACFEGMRRGRRPSAPSTQEGGEP